MLLSGVRRWASTQRVAGTAAVREVLRLAALKPRKFDESVDIDLVLSLDPKKPQQQVRALVSLPHGTGKSKRVAAFVHDDESRSMAEAAGADIIGDIEAVSKGVINFQAAVSTAAALAEVTKKCAKILGPRGLLPGPKNSGTLANSSKELLDCVKTLKSGPVSLRTEPKQGVLHAPFGRVSFGADKLIDNLRALMIAVQAAKPEKAPKGTKFVKQAYISSTMGSPSVQVDVTTLDPASPRFLRDIPVSSQHEH